MTAQPDLFPGRRRKPPPALEVRTHIALADTLRRFRRPEWKFWHLPSGEYRSKATARKLQRMGAGPGLPDFLLLGPPGVRFLELKRGALGRLNEGQEEFRWHCFRCGIPYEVARSFDEAIAVLESWGALKPGVHWQ